MSKKSKKKKKRKKKLKQRNPFALDALTRRSNKFKDRREPRQGSKNKQQEYLDEDYKK